MTESRRFAPVSVSRGRRAAPGRADRCRLDGVTGRRLRKRILFFGALVAVGLVGCARPATGPRRIVAGTPCAACGMRIEDLRFACEDERNGAFQFYDSIECLLRAEPAFGRAWLADYDARTLHSADSIWVVQGDLPSPMGGGYAGFLDRSTADEIASSRRGRVARLADFAARESLEVQQ